MMLQRKKRNQSNFKPDWKAKVDYNFYWVNKDFDIQLIGLSLYEARAINKYKIFKSLEKAIEWCEKELKNV